jgi:hypothetical protein
MPISQASVQAVLGVAIWASSADRAALADQEAISLDLPVPVQVADEADLEARAGQQAAVVVVAAAGEDSRLAAAVGSRAAAVQGVAGDEAEALDGVVPGAAGVGAGNRTRL